MTPSDQGPSGEASVAQRAAGRSALDALDEAIQAMTGCPPVNLADGYPDEQGHEPSPAPARPGGHRLGSLSEKFESGGRGPGTVSSGIRDPGGVSYGLYQLASRTGTVAAFLAAEGVRWSLRFIGRAPGTPAFSAVWTDIARDEPDAFAEAQHAFIERTHYRPAVDAVKSRTGLDLDKRSDAVRDACWSCAVQHGGAAKLLARAVGRADSAGQRAGTGYDRALVEAIYDERSDYVRKLAERADSGARRTMLSLVSGRYPAERAAALAMLERAGKGS